MITHNQPSTCQRGIILPKMPTPLRVIIVVVLICLLLWGILNAVIIGLFTAALTPTFIKLFTADPALIAVAYLCYIAACAAFVAGSGVMIYTVCRILQRKPIKIIAPIILVGCIVIYLLCSCVVLPVVTGAGL